MDYTGGQAYPRRGFTTSSSARVAVCSHLTMIGFLNRELFHDGPNCRRPRKPTAVEWPSLAHSDPIPSSATGVTTTIDPHGPRGVITAVAMPHRNMPPPRSRMTAGPPESPRHTRAPTALATANRGLPSSKAVLSAAALSVPATRLEIPTPARRKVLGIR